MLCSRHAQIDIPVATHAARYGASSLDARGRQEYEIEAAEARSKGASER